MAYQTCNRQSVKSYKRTSDRYLTRIGLFQNDFDLCSSWYVTPGRQTLYKSNLYSNIISGTLCRVQMVYNNSSIQVAIDGKFTKHRVEYINRQHKTNAPRVVDCWKLFRSDFSVTSYSAEFLTWFMDRPIIIDHLDSRHWHFHDNHIILAWFDRIDRLTFSLCLQHFTQSHRECFALIVFIHQYL
jgi:hypothetical protein